MGNWYVVQTAAGKELKSAEKIKKELDRTICKNVIVIQYEAAWRIEGRYKLHTEVLFPSCLFIETEDPKMCSRLLERIYGVGQLIEADGEFLTVPQKEQELFIRLCGAKTDWTVRRMAVKADEDGNIVSAEGFLGEHLDRIVKKRLRKRMVLLELPLMGKMQRIPMGIKLEKDPA